MEPVINLQLLDSLDVTLKASLRPLSGELHTRDSIFTTTQPQEIKRGKFPNNRKEIDQYKQDVESRIQEFFQVARELDNALVTIQLQCAEHPCNQLREEIALMQASIGRKEQMLATHTAKLQNWMATTSALSQSQTSVLHIATDMPGFASADMEEDETF